jgi:sec-independent protein translocase protein TatB
VLFIFESIGTSELILIGIVALIFLGPRKLPEIAKKIGKIMAEFRGTANEFKETWQREVSFEEESKAFDLNAIENEAEAHTVARAVELSEPTPIEPPAIKEVDPASIAALEREASEENEKVMDANSKETWL